MEVALDRTPRSSTRSTALLVEAAVRGEREASRTLVEPYLGVALGAATVIAGSAADGSDAVQDALVSAWQGLDRLREPDAFPAWFRRHVVRAATRTRRTRARRHVVELDASTVDPGTDIDRAVAKRTLAGAFDRLDDDDRVLLTLHHLWRLPIAETAAHLGVPEGTVKSRVHYAMDRLRAAFDAEERR